MSRQVVVIWGGHAAGKTTFCKHLSEAVNPDKVNVIFGDLDKRFKGEVGWKRDNLTTVLQEDQRHIVFEGMRAPCGLFDIFLENCPGMTLMLVLSPPQRLLASMTHRKESNGNQFTEKQKEYWTQSKLAYESKTRFLNQLVKLSTLYPDQVRGVDLRLVKHSADATDFSAFEPEFIRLLRVLR